jgi:hypothetical protein
LDFFIGNLVNGNYSACPASSSIDEAQMVRQVFEGYKQAVLSENREVAASFLSQDTIDYYGAMSVMDTNLLIGSYHSQSDVTS